MKLPTKKLIKVTYEYQDGQRYFVIGKALELWKSQIQGASVMAGIHGVEFKEIDWKKGW